MVDRLGSAPFPTVRGSSFLSNYLGGLSMCSRPPKLLWTVRTWSKIVSIREPSVHAFPLHVLCSASQIFPNHILCAASQTPNFRLNETIESMTQTSGLCRAHSSSFTVRPRVEQGTSWASETDGKGHCRGRSGSTDFVPGRNWTEIFDFHVRTWTEPNYAWQGPSQVRRSRISEHSRWAI